VLNFAEIPNLPGSDPRRKINLPEADEVDRPVLDAGQVEALADALGPDQAVMMHVALVTGARWGECAAITVGSLDYRRGEISLHHQLDRKKLVKPKTRAGRRTMAVPEWLLVELSEVLARRGLTAADTDALVFVSPEGEPLHYSNWRRRVWLPAVEAAGLAGLGFHTLKSNAATALVAAGVDPKVAQVRLGHTDVRVTLGIYARATSEADRRAADKVGERFRPRGLRRKNAGWTGAAGTSSAANPL
jgi:integrase